MADDGNPFANGGSSKGIVNPDIILNGVDRVFKAFLNRFEIAVMARIRAKRRRALNPDLDIKNALVEERLELSGALDGQYVKTYAEVAKARISVDDRKRIYQKDENLM